MFQPDLIHVSVIIVVFTQLLSILLAKVRQPRVIAEVIGQALLFYRP